MSVLVEEIADDIREFNKKVVKASKSDHGLAKSEAGGSKGPQPKAGSRGSLGGQYFILSQVLIVGVSF